MQNRKKKVVKKRKDRDKHKNTDKEINKSNKDSGIRLLHTDEVNERRRLGPGL